MKLREVEELGQGGGARGGRLVIVSFLVRAPLCKCMCMGIMLMLNVV